MKKSNYDDNILKGGAGSGIKGHKTLLNTEQLEALQEWQSGIYNSKNGGYTTINQYLREGKPKFGTASEESRKMALDMASQISSAIAKSPIKKDMIVYRGLKLSKELTSELRIGEVLQDKGFSSTTNSRTIANRFADDKKTGVVMIISLKEGQAALNINEYLPSSKENEILLDKNSQFIIKDKRVKQGKTFIQVELLNTSVIKSIDISNIESQNQTLVDLLKAKAFPVGTVREYNGYKYVKQSDGWKPLKQTKTTENKEPKVETSETPGPLAAEQTLPKTEQQTTSATMDLDNKVLTKDQPPKTKVMTGLRTGKKSAVPYQPPPGSKVNLVGITAFGKSKADVQKELNAHLYDCEVVLQDLGLSFKQPLDFTCERIAEPKQIQADFERLNNKYQSNNRIGITDRSSGISKSLIHEIGHAVDYSLKAEDSRGSFFGDLSKDPFHKSKPLYDELKAILEASPIYKQRSDKSYLADPGEIFARSFEVYAYSRTRQLHKDGRVGGNFINAFNPDLLRATHTDRDSSREDREEVISRVSNIMEKLLQQNPIVKSLSLLESLNNQLLKSKSKEIGAISSSGKYRKVAEGKWEEIKNQGKPQSKEDSAPTAKELSVEEHKKQSYYHFNQAVRYITLLDQLNTKIRDRLKVDPKYKVPEEAQRVIEGLEAKVKFYKEQYKRHNAEGRQSWKGSSKKPANLQQKLKQKIIKGGDPKPEGTSTYNSIANIKRKENRVSGEEAGTSTNNAAHRWTTSGSQASDAARKKEEKEQKKQSKKTLREWKMVDGELIEVTSGHGRGPDKQPRKKRALTKALIGENDNSGVAINTTDYALEAERSGDWLELFQGYLNGFKIGDVPVEISLNDRFSVLIGQVDDGLYSAYVKQLKDVEGNDAPENVSRINSQPLPAIIQYLKAKEFIRELAKPVEPATIESESGLVPVMPTVMDTSELSAALSCYKDNDAIRLVEALNRLLGR